jgi:polyphosphate kinase
MKTIVPTLVIIGLIVAAFLAGLFYHHVAPAPSPRQLTLEQIISIRELHLVKHQYHDIFLLHRKNDPGKPVRAIVQVPVTVTAFLNLKDIKLEYHHDTLQRVILPHAILHQPVCELNNMTIRETRGFQLHLGKDLYPQVGRYLSSAIQTELDSTRHRAIAHQILVQAEAEGKEYLESILLTLGHAGVAVTFNDAAKDQEVQDYIQALHRNRWVPTRPSIIAKANPFMFGILR